MKRTDFISLFAGLIFGAGLILAGMTQPSKVVGFFDFAGDWDPSLALVMVGAIAVYTPAYRFSLRRASPLFAEGYFLPTQRKIEPGLLSGSLLFGAGWAMSGFCPGPALVSAGSLGSEALLFGGGLFGGFLIFHLGERALLRRRGASGMSARGRTTILTGLMVVLLGAPASSAGAFCGFYVGGAEGSLFNDATMVVMMREGTRTVLSMQNNYQGPPEDFAMIVPVPVVLAEENVKTLPREVFARVDRLAAPRLVEYWESDPCGPPVRPMRRQSRRYRSGGANPRAGLGSARDLGVTIEAEFAVAEYDIVILSAEDSSGLDTWLRQEGYHIPDGAEPALRPYVQSGTKFFVAKVDAERVTFVDGRATLSPLRVHYDSDEFSLPVRLGMINSSGEQDLIVHILARAQRYETANYPNVFIPTNIEVADSVREDFGAFYAALFDKTLEVNPGSVVTEYSWRSGSCDPCPGPTLSDSDIHTLGADVGGGVPTSRPPGRGGRMRSRGGLAQAYTLTRLHYRYGPGDLGEDLVFRAAPGITGGRGVPDPKGVMSQETQPASTNNFQGRYAILHRWEGAMECAEPARGRWGGPPGGGSHRTSAATDLGSQRRRDVALGTAIAVPVPELRLTPAGSSPPTDEPPSENAPSLEAASATAQAAPASALDEEPGLFGCSVAPSAFGTTWLLGLVVGLGFVATRRRRA